MAKILVVDYDPNAVRAMTVHLERAGHVVESATDGQEALLRAVADPPDVLTTTLMLPRMSGDELVRALRGDPIFASLTIVIMHHQPQTGPLTEDLPEFADLRGQVIWLERLFGLPDLIRVVDRAGEPRVLVMDHEPKIVDLMTQHLAQAGYAVESASDGKEALEKIRANPPGLLVTDLTPRIRGDELVRTLRADPKFASLPIIMMHFQSQTPPCTRDLPEFADLRDRVVWLMKPFHPRELVHIVDQALKPHSSSASPTPNT